MLSMLIDLLLVRLLSHSSALKVCIQALEVLDIVLDDMI